MQFPNIDPVAFSFGFMVVRWYSLAYIAGILLGWWYVGKLIRRTEQVTGSAAMSLKELEDVVSWAIGGVVLGGRLGYVLFYQPEFYLEHPEKILHVWEGGMSFHGGFLGVVLATLWFCKKRGLQFFRVIDMFACATPIGLFFGRLANFVNGELFGRATTVPWGIIFPHGGDLPRHPSQLYEAVLEGLLLFAVLALMAWRSRALAYPRMISGAFLIGYGLSRIIVEFFREPDVQLGFLFGGWLTMGMLLSVPMVLLGIYLIWLSRRKAL